MRLLDAAVLDERLARKEFRRQIAVLEARLAEGVPYKHRAGRGLRQPPPSPRLLSFAELAGVRDALVARVARTDAAAREVAAGHAAARELLAAMATSPQSYRRARVSLADLGEPGCGVYRVRPRLGLVGMLAGWWELTLSSGCPLGTAP